jgi:hypothetical protein
MPPQSPADTPKPPPASVPGWTPGPPPLDKAGRWVFEIEYGVDDVTSHIVVIDALGQVACACPGIGNKGRRDWIATATRHYGPIPPASSPEPQANG